MYIVSIAIEKRKQTVPKIQDILTKFGDEIHSRMGFHNIEVGKEYIIIVYTGKHIDNFVEELKGSENVIVNFMKVD